MAIDLRNVEPLASKSQLGGSQGSLLEQALRRGSAQATRKGGYHRDMEIEDDMMLEGPRQSFLPSELEWVKEDKDALQNLVKQMDQTMGDLSRQLQQVKVQSLQSRSEIEKEQQLLFKQIHTLNNLMSKQVKIFSAMEKQMSALDINRGPVLQNAAIGVIAGLASAVTLVVLSPFASQILQKLMA